MRVSQPYCFQRGRLSARTCGQDSKNPVTLQFLHAIVKRLRLHQPVSSCMSDHLIKISHELHEVLDFVPIIVHEEVVDLIDVVRLLDEHDKI